MIEQLASQLGRNDEVPNIELAERLCDTEDKKGIAEIVEGLKGKDKAIANDAIKVLYEIGERKPALIAPYAGNFLSLLSSKNNRLVWGAMTALSWVADLAADSIFDNIDLVLSAFHGGSVITVDNSVSVLAKLCRANAEYEAYLFPKLLNHLENCRPKEVPQHAERMVLCINEGNVSRFLEVIKERKNHLSDTQRKRVEKLEKGLLPNTK